MVLVEKQKEKRKIPIQLLELKKGPNPLLHSSTSAMILFTIQTPIQTLSVHCFNQFSLVPLEGSVSNTLLWFMKDDEDPALQDKQNPEPKTSLNIL